VLALFILVGFWKRWASCLGRRSILLETRIDVQIV